MKILLTHALRSSARKRLSFLVLLTLFALSGITLPYPAPFILLNVGLVAIFSVAIGLALLGHLRKSRALGEKSKKIEEEIVLGDPIPLGSHVSLVIFAPINLEVIDGSSVWLRNTIDVISDETPLLVVVPNNLDIDKCGSDVQELLQKPNVGILRPRNFSVSRIHSGNLAAVMEALDDKIPNLQRLITRGFEESLALVQSRRFQFRLSAYLTDFYDLDSSGTRKFTERARAGLGLMARRGVTFLCQTKEVERAIQSLTRNQSINSVLTPPLAPVDKPLKELNSTTSANEIIKLVYAGKDDSRWGITELAGLLSDLEANQIRFSLEMHVAKRSRSSSPKTQSILMNRNVIHREASSMNEVIEALANSDVAYCWRPSRLEEGTLELSTKLVEAASLGIPIICYPSDSNRELLGEDYPGFTRDPREFIDVLGSLLQTPTEFYLDLAQSVIRRHGRDALRKELLASRSNSYEFENLANTILFAGHDFKFIDSYASGLKSAGNQVLFEKWGWDSPPRSAQVDLTQVDVIFCEWGLGNAIFYSNHLPPGAKLIVRIHLQELHGAAKLARKIKHDAVTLFIFVSEHVRNDAIEKFGWAREKTMVIPNYVLDEEYVAVYPKNQAGEIRLGMLGMVPKRKRLDRSLDALEALIQGGHLARLSVKSVDPLRWEGKRESERGYFEENLARVRKSPLIRNKVLFDVFDPYVHDWYEGLEFILSPSDFESFHYAVADGVAMGCFPVIWNWPSATTAYPADWVCSDTLDAVERILELYALGEADKIRMREENRRWIISNYGMKSIQRILSEQIVGVSGT